MVLQIRVREKSKRPYVGVGVSPSMAQQQCYLELM